MKSITLALVLFPSFMLAQPAQEDYAIYSRYLKVFTESRKVKKIHFVVRQLTTDSYDIDDVVNNLRNYSAGKASLYDVYFLFKESTPIVTKDTLWIPLIARLSQKTKQKFVIENKFPSDIPMAIIDSVGYDSYFGPLKSSKQIEKNWKRFHGQYSAQAALIELSEVFSDGQRAAFYFSARCGGLCGEGDLVLFSKENGEWEFLVTVHLWVS